MTDTAYMTDLEMIESIPGPILTEASLSRVLRQVQSGEGFLILSAYRSDRDEDDRNANRRMNADLRAKMAQIIRSRGFGYSRVLGSWLETRTAKDGSKYQERVSEPSFFIVGISEREARELTEIAFRKPYDQEAVVFGIGGENVNLWNRDEPDAKLGPPTVSRLATLYTAVVSSSLWKKGDRGDKPPPTVQRFSFGEAHIEPVNMGTAYQSRMFLREVYERCAAEGTLLDATADTSQFGEGWQIMVPGDAVESVVREIQRFGFSMRREDDSSVNAESAVGVLSDRDPVGSVVRIVDSKGGKAGEVRFSLFSEGYLLTTTDRRLLERLEAILSR